MIIANCLICFDPFSHKNSLSVLSCGHIFHQECIKKWFKTNMTCPTCRKDHKKKTYIEKIFFDQANNEISLNNIANDFNENEVVLNSRITKLQMEKKDLSDKIEKIKQTFETKISKLELEKKAINKKYVDVNLVNKSLSEKLKSVKENCSSAISEKASKENEILQLKKEFSKLNFINDMLKDSTGESPEIIKTLRGSGDLLSQLDAISNALVICQNEKNTIQKTKIKLQDEMKIVRRQNEKLQSKIHNLEEMLKTVKAEKDFDKVNLIEYEKYFKTANNISSAIRRNITGGAYSYKYNNDAQSDHSNDEENNEIISNEFASLESSSDYNPFLIIPPKPKPTDLLQNLNIMKKSCTDSIDFKTFRMNSDIYKIPVKKSTKQTNVKILPIKRQALKSQTNITNFFK